MPVSLPLRIARYPWCLVHNGVVRLTSRGRPNPAPDPLCVLYGTEGHWQLYIWPYFHWSAECWHKSLPRRGRCLRVDQLRELAPYVRLLTAGIPIDLLGRNLLRRCAGGHRVSYQVEFAVLYMLESRAMYCLWVEGIDGPRPDRRPATDLHPNIEVRGARLLHRQ